jgi:hypothetical protein
MRPLLIAFAALAVSAAPALSQDMQGLARQNELWAQQEMARQRSVATELQFNTATDHLATAQRLQALRAQNKLPTITTSTPEPDTARLMATPSLAMPSIPDAELAASRARIEAASQNRR